jgi:hypothetical protein
MRAYTGDHGVYYGTSSFGAGEWSIAQARLSSAGAGLSGIVFVAVLIWLAIMRRPALLFVSHMPFADNPKVFTASKLPSTR